MRPGQIRLVNLNLDSPRMQEAMQILGYEKEDLDTRKRKEHFYEEADGMPSPKGKDPKTVSKELKTISQGQVEEELIKLRFKHYQDRLMDRINRVLQARKQIKMRRHTRDAMKNKSTGLMMNNGATRPQLFQQANREKNLQAQMRMSQTSFDQQFNKAGMMENGLPKLRA